ncbi:flagellar export protein FliJ [uncultured Ramlibacter sp.]|uniref:flagellar export protein FliJ n=1 Tax=uncultured Ramlibacter sp. TaxID=260755 RepID=UPI002611E5A0|nr:flagellar export protein FliJ [uncultured Ramlibacter sp.]
MDKVLPLLTDTALKARDKQTLMVRDAAVAVQQADATLRNLQQFRTELLARAPGSRGSPADAQSLLDHQAFVVRLDEAIAMQTLERLRRQERCDAEQQRLIEQQQRLMAFQTLARRRAASHQLKESRRAQSDSDEFAARASRRAS